MHSVSSLYIFVRGQFSPIPECLVDREGVSRAVWGGVDEGKSLWFPLELDVRVHNVVLLPVHPLVAAHQHLLLLLLHPHPPNHLAAGPRPLLGSVLVVRILLLVEKPQSLGLLLVF